MRWYSAFFGLVALSGIAAGGCTGPLGGQLIETTSSGSWRITREADKVTGGQVANIALRASKTTNSLHYDAPRARLQLVCLKGQVVPHFQFGDQVGSKADSEITYRFDNGPSHSIKGHILRGLKIVVIDDKREAAQFLSELKGASVLYFVISSLAKGRTAAQFPVAGASAAIATTRAGCQGRGRT